MIEGEIAPGFEAVREAFENNFTEHGDVGAAVAVYVKGTKVVDLWGGSADAKAERPWDEGTTALVFSTTKGITAILAHLLAQRGVIDLDAPVVQYWPEYAAEGKERTTVRHLLAHRAGLPTLDERTTPEEGYVWATVTERLARQRPAWKPGTRHGYHAVTYGWLVGEVIRRATGKPIGQVLAEEISGPLGLDTWIGLPPEEEARVARLRPAPGAGTPPSPEVLAGLPEDVQRQAKAMVDTKSLTFRALNPTKPSFNFNSPELHAAEIPGANGITTARSLAKLYASTVSTVDGTRLLEPATVADASREQSSGPDEVLIVRTRFGSGFMLPSPFEPLMGPSSFGHPGAGGSLGFADADTEVGFGYVMNTMQTNLANDPRTEGLIEAVRRSL
jgi:CubicO group peptidase (beta-lactamase class C family)